MRIGLLVFTLLGCVALAQEKPPITWRFSKPPIVGRAVPGATVKVKVTAAISDGWHLYSLKKLDGGPIPTSIAVPPEQPFTLDGPIHAEEPMRLDDPVFGMEVEFYIESAEFTVPVKIAAGVKPGVQKLTIAPRYQTCNGKLCFPPRTVKLELPVEVNSR
jgi:thiol:disulfide interchange protein DsbD